jgi:hypothetical protein
MSKNYEAPCYALSCNVPLNNNPVKNMSIRSLILIMAVKNKKVL